MLVGVTVLFWDAASLRCGVLESRTLAERWTLLLCEESVFSGSIEELFFCFLRGAAFHVNEERGNGAVRDRFDSSFSSDRWRRVPGKRNVVYIRSGDIFDNLHSLSSSSVIFSYT